MKNVAGYDMTKLLVGSFGALGVITEVTIRLLPRPATQSLLVLPLPSLEHGQDLAAGIMDSCLQPLVLEVVSSRLSASLRPALPSAKVAGAGAPLLLAGFAGHPAAVTRSLADVSSWSGLSAGVVLGDPEADTLLEVLAEHSASTGTNAPGAAVSTGAHEPDASVPKTGRATKKDSESGNRRLTARALAPIGRVWRLAEVAESLASDGGLQVAYRIGAARGILDLWVEAQPGGQASSQRLAAWVTGLRKAAVTGGGHLLITDGVHLLGADLDAWGDLGPAVQIMKRIKKRLDPDRILNPGRFVGGM